MKTEHAKVFAESYFKYLFFRENKFKATEFRTFAQTILKLNASLEKDY